MEGGPPQQVQTTTFYSSNQRGFGRGGSTNNGQDSGWDEGGSQQDGGGWGRGRGRGSQSKPAWNKSSADSNSNWRSADRGPGRTGGDNEIEVASSDIGRIIGRLILCILVYSLPWKNIHRLIILIKRPSNVFFTYFETLFSPQVRGKENSVWL